MVGSAETKFTKTRESIIVKNKNMSVNKSILIGNVGKDPEIRYLQDGTAVANFSLATTETWKNKAGEKQTETTWHRIVAWRHLAELAEKYITKGKQIYVEGQITTNKWEDKDGNKRETTEIKAHQIQFLGSKKDSQESAPGKLETYEDAVEGFDNGDGPPF